MSGCHLNEGLDGQQRVVSSAGDWQTESLALFIQENDIGGKANGLGVGEAHNDGQLLLRNANEAAFWELKCKRQVLLIRRCLHLDTVVGSSKHIQ